MPCCFYDKACNNYVGFCVLCSIQWLSPIVKKRLTVLCCSNLLGKTIKTKHVAAVCSSVVRNGRKGTSNAFAVPFYRRIM